MTTKEMPGVIRSAWLPLLAIGVLTLILGVLVLAWPGPSILVASVLFGIYLVASGVVEVILVFSLPHLGCPPSPAIHRESMSFSLGLLAFRHFGQGYAALLLALWAGIGFIFQGVATTLTAISHRDLPARGWNIFFGVISVVAGIIVTSWPFGSLLTLALVAGCWLIVIGIVQTVTAIVMCSDLKKANPSAAP